MDNVKITFNENLIKEITDVEAVEALEKTANALKTDVINDQVIPFFKGVLQVSTFVKICGKKAFLCFATPYASKLYNMPTDRISKEKNKNARSEWMYDWIRGAKKNFCIDTFTKFLKR